MSLTRAPTSLRYCSIEPQLSGVVAAVLYRAVRDLTCAMTSGNQAGTRGPGSVRPGKS